MATFSRTTFNSSLYRSFRPVYSKTTYDLIYEYHKQKGGKFNVALDIGTGTGQVATVLAETFAKVHATDLSEKMLQAADKRPNISYSACPAEKLPFEDKSVDVITTAQAFHWFKHDQFFEEAKRVLKPNGTIAIIGYEYARIRESKQASSLIRKIGLETFGDYWDSGRKILENLYRDIPIPYPNTTYYFSPGDADITNIGNPTPETIMEKVMTLEAFKNYMHTWSSYANYMKEHSEDPVDSMMNEIAKLLNADNLEKHLVTVEWPAVLILTTPQ
ncbi:hypothetical protein INT43_006561 [Umbelopsis isabellina]|uniref:Methyltransferase type 11 domain-containing protein n=1 Tax=Mortierella isabellina TaxID=91625 RepID=A0A8H7Q1F3_MORIS|nr:hypothetical protein INT43_006561 [Umbelopsis isabellina]